jgi:hypothetical protein
MLCHSFALYESFTTRIAFKAMHIAVSLHNALDDCAVLDYQPRFSSAKRARFKFHQLSSLMSAPQLGQKF